MNWPMAFVIVGVAVAFFWGAGNSLSARKQAEAQQMAACVAAGSEWIQTWGDPECRRPNTQTEQERP